MFSQDLLIVVRTVLAARCPATVCLQTVRGAVRVMNAALWGPAQGNSHGQSADRQVFLHSVADGPADHPTGMQVQDDGQIDPAFARPDIGDVTGLLPGNGLPANHERAFLVGLARSKILLQEIWRDVECVVAVRPSSGK